MSEKHCISARLTEVWEWKEAISREVADLPVDEALREIAKKARLAAEECPLPRRSPLRTPSRRTD